MEKDHARPPPRPWAEGAPFIRRPSTQGDVPMATSWGHSPAFRPCRIGPSRRWPRARPAGRPAHAQQRPSSVAGAVLCQGRPRSAAPSVGAGVLPRSGWDPTGSPLSGCWLFHRRPSPAHAACAVSAPHRPRQGPRFSGAPHAKGTQDARGSWAGRGVASRKSRPWAAVHPTRPATLLQRPRVFRSL